MLKKKIGGLCNRRQLIKGLGLYASWFIGKNIYNFKELQNKTILPEPVSVVSTNHGDDIYLQGYVFKGVQPGDIILRQIDINWGTIVNKIFNRFVALGVPKYYHHASMYIGEGKVLNIGPDDPARIIIPMSLLEKDSLGSCPLGHFHILRMSSNKAIRNKALGFIEFHQKLGEQQKVKFKFESTIKKINLSNPIYYSNHRFDYYYDGLTCILGFIKAYDYAGLNIEQKITAKRNGQEIVKSLLYFLYPSEKTLQKFIDQFWFTGYHLKQYSEKEIYPEKT